MKYHSICAQILSFPFKCVTLLTYITEQYREEDETMCGPQQHYGQEHPEVEDLEDLGLGKC